jgi:hypothetical protein
VANHSVRKGHDQAYNYSDIGKAKREKSRDPRLEYLCTGEAKVGIGQVTVVGYMARALIACDLLAHDATLSLGSCQCYMLRVL